MLFMTEKILKPFYYTPNNWKLYELFDLMAGTEKNIKFHRNRYENMSSNVITIIYALSYLIDLL